MSNDAVPPRELTNRLSVCPQISPDDVPALQEMGFGTIICNRPDGEASDQPKSNDIQQTCTAEGMEFHYIPVVPGQFAEQQLAQFTSALATSEKPVLAYCRTGTRSATLWALSEAGKQPTKQIIANAANAGYDLSKLAGYLGRE